MHDAEGKPIREGDVIMFSYGIPPVRVEAKVAKLNGVVFAMTPGHNPAKCELSKLRQYVGDFYRIRSTTV
jgi:hypothetical protein